MPLDGHRTTKVPSRTIELASYSLIAPAFALMLLLVLGPATAVFVIALSDWQFGAHSLNFVGIANFEAMLADPVFRASFTNTMIYVGVVVPGTIVSGLVVALLIESGQSLRSLYRAAHFLPVMATLAAMAIAWEAMLHPTIGLVNQLLADLGLPTANWLRDREFALATLCMIGIWQHLGFAMVLFLAGLKAIPKDLYDAAEIDGADGAFSRLRTVTLPMLSPVMMFVVIVVALRAFEVFDTVKILTQGGPGNATETLLHTLYVESFEFLRVGYGAALTVVFLLIVVVLTLGQARIFDRRVHYE